MTAFSHVTAVVTRADGISPRPTGSIRGTRLVLAGLAVVLVGLDQAVQDPGEVTDVAGCQAA